MDPLHFRAGSEERRCGTCQHHSDVTAEVGYCGLYERPLFVGELCDSWSIRGVLVWEEGLNELPVIERPGEL